VVFAGQLVPPAGESLRVSFHTFQLSFKTQTSNSKMVRRVASGDRIARYALEVMPSLDEEKR